MRILFLLLTLCAPLSAAQPNVLWIFIEDMSPWLGCTGDPINKDATPNIDRLAAGGVRFSHCYVPCPVCSPCRSALITGAYQTTNGLHNHRSSRSKEGAIHLPEGVTTLPQLFRKAGYQTFNAGKEDYNFVYQRDQLYEKNGKNRLAAWRGLDGDKPFFGQIQLSGGKSKTKSVSNKVNPSTVTPPPYFPDTPLFKKWHAHHYDTIRQTDSDTKSLLDNLKADGLLDNTLIFWFTDHGNNHSLRAKQFCTEAGTHVPLIITGPHEALASPAVREDLISALDIPATSLALAGLPVPDYFEGQNLFGEKFSPRDHVISARDRCDYTIDRIRTVRTEHFRYIRNFLTDRPLLQPQYRDRQEYTKVLRKGHAEGTLPKLTEEIFFGPRPAEELYDLRADPHEIHNLAEDPAFAKECARHRALLEKWIKDTDDKGQYPESDAGLREVLKQWKGRCVNPEYDRVRKGRLSVKDYESRKINGFVVHVQKSLSTHPRLPQALAHLEKITTDVLATLPEKSHPELLAVPLWLSQNTNPGACYHPSVDWLRSNNRMVEKARSIEFQNIDHFLDWAPAQPAMLTHELAHAYHHRVLNFQSPEITATFKEAQASGKYERVAHVNGKTQRHYALSNEKEYFAELTEAYFSKNDFHPFNRAELKAFDPKGYAMIRKIWGIEGGQRPK